MAYTCVVVSTLPTEHSERVLLTRKIRPLRDMCNDHIQSLVNALGRMRTMSRILYITQRYS